MMNARRVASLVAFLFVVPAVGLAQPRLPGWAADKLPVVDERPDLVARPWTARGREARAVATTQFHGGAMDRSWGTASNWDNGVPGAASTAIVLANAATGIDGGSPAVDNPALIFISEGYPYEIGQAGNPLKMDAVKVVHEGSNTLHYYNKASVVSRFICNSPKKLNAMRLTGNARIGIVDVVRGHVVFESGLGANGVGVLNLAFDHCTRYDCRTTLERGAGDVLVCNQVAGVFECRHSVTRHIQAGGTTYLMPTAIGMANVWLGAGTFVHNMPTSAGSVDLAYILGGTYDCTQTKLSKTLTSYVLFPGAELLANKLVTRGGYIVGDPEAY